MKKNLCKTEKWLVCYVCLDNKTAYKISKELYDHLKKLWFKNYDDLTKTIIALNVKHL
jgi:hypothetical protein